MYSSTRSIQPYIFLGKLNIERRIIFKFYQHHFVWYFKIRDNISWRSSMASWLQLKRFNVRVTVTSWCSVHAPQQTGLEITWRDTLKFRATMILACNESPKLSPSSEGEGDKQVSSCELLKMLRKGKHRRFLFENKYLKPVTVKYEKWT